MAPCAVRTRRSEVKHYQVESKNLLSVGYDPFEKVLEVVFRAAPQWIYSYQHVGLIKYARLMTAHSVGEYFERQIRSRPKLHPYTKRKA